MKGNGIGLAVAALIIYILGGIGIFAGLALIVFMNGHELGEWGDGRNIGYLLFSTGLGLSIAAVLLMRIFRNRIAS